MSQQNQVLIPPLTCGGTGSAHRAGWKDIIGRGAAPGRHSLLAVSRFDKLVEKIARRPGDAVVWQERTYRCGELDRRRRHWQQWLVSHEIQPGEVVGLSADHAFDSIAIFLALLSNRNVAALLSPAATDSAPLLASARARHHITARHDGDASYHSVTSGAGHPLLDTLRESGSGGFVVFSSGSTGAPKAVLHNIERFLTKFDRANKPLRTLAFLLLDHIAGVDTLFYTLCSGGVVVCPVSRDVEAVCRLIESQRVEVLPASPTFLNLLCLSQADADYDLESLRIITYGSEPMSRHVLQSVTRRFPQCRVIQKYGTSEFGSPLSQSKNDDSLWIRIGSDHCRYRVVDNLLWIKSDSAMLGYLNAPNPFSQDGWLCTGDEAVSDGPWIHILGRRSEVIVVGGEKVSPVEVENTLLEMPEMLDVAVYGEPHPLTGHIVAARIRMRSVPKDVRGLKQSIRRFCRTRLEPYKIPVKFSFTTQPLASPRQKKIRRKESS